MQENLYPVDSILRRLQFANVVLPDHAIRDLRVVSSDCLHWRKQRANPQSLDGQRIGRDQEPARAGNARPPALQRRDAECLQRQTTTSAMESHIPQRLHIALREKEPIKLPHLENKTRPLKGNLGQ